MKKKLKLDVDNLAVVSFAPAGGVQGRGTVPGYSGECGSSVGFMVCNCFNDPADPTWYNATCHSGEPPCLC